MDDDQAIIIKDAQGIFFNSQNNTFADQRMRDDKAVAFKTDRTILVDLSENPIGGIERLPWERPQVRLFSFETDNDDFMGGTVYTLIFHLQPDAKKAAIDIATK